MCGSRAELSWALRSPIYTRCGSRGASIAGLDTAQKCRSPSKSIFPSSLQGARWVRKGKCKINKMKGLKENNNNNKK